MEQFFILRGDIASQWVFIDGSYVRAHQHASGAWRGEERVIWLSRRDLITKIHLCASAHGNPIDFEITGGEAHDSQVAKQLIKLAEVAEHLIADQGYDSEAIRGKAKAMGMKAVIPRRSHSKKENPEFDRLLYKHRHFVENLFSRLKHFRSVATGFEKLARNYKSILYRACTFVWLKLKS